MFSERECFTLSNYEKWCDFSVIFFQLILCDPGLIASEPDGDLVLRDDAPDEIRKEWETFLKTYHAAHDGNPEPIDLPPQK